MSSTGRAFADSDSDSAPLGTSLIACLDALPVWLVPPAIEVPKGTGLGSSDFILVKNIFVMLSGSMLSTSPTTISGPPAPLPPPCAAPPAPSPLRTPAPPFAPPLPVPPPFPVPRSPSSSASEASELEREGACLTGNGRPSMSVAPGDRFLGLTARNPVLPMRSSLNRGGVFPTLARGPALAACCGWGGIMGERWLRFGSKSACAEDPSLPPRPLMGFAGLPSRKPPILPSPAFCADGSARAAPLLALRAWCTLGALVERSAPSCRPSAKPCAFRARGAT
ncbi:unnamed protein product [Closterium sp. Yama58-4]|nr:unnamed protein product [Closterium sp. Yama58-4]